MTLPRCKLMWYLTLEALHAFPRRGTTERGTDMAITSKDIAQRPVLLIMS